MRPQPARTTPRSRSPLAGSMPPLARDAEADQATQSRLIRPFASSTTRTKLIERSRLALSRFLYIAQRGLVSPDPPVGIRARRISFQKLPFSLFALTFPSGALMGARAGSMSRRSAVSSHHHVAGETV